MFDPCAWAGNTGVTPLLAFGLRFVSLGFVLDVHTPAFSLEALFTRFVFITFVRPYVTAGIGGVQHLFKRVGVVFLRGADVAFSDQLVVAVGTDAELVTVVAFAVFLRPTGFKVFLATLGGCPIGGGRILFQDCLFFFAEVLPWGFHQRGINDLSASGNEPVLLQLPLHRVKQRISTACDPYPFTENPEGVGIRDAAGIPQATETLEQQAVKQLVFQGFVRQVVEVCTTSIRTISSVGYGGRPPGLLSGRGAIRSISAANAEKLTCFSNLDSRSPLRSSFCSRSLAANRLVLIALFFVMVRGCVVGQAHSFSYPGAERGF